MKTEAGGGRGEGVGEGGVSPDGRQHMIDSTAFLHTSCFKPVINQNLREDQYQGKNHFYITKIAALIRLKIFKHVSSC
jgi:hypothetical protein